MQPNDILSAVEQAIRDTESALSRLDAVAGGELYGYGYTGREKLVSATDCLRAFAHEIRSKTVTPFEGFYDGKGNIGELENFTDGTSIARLSRPGVSRGEFASSSDGKVATYRGTVREPDTLYDRFEGSRSEVIAWLNAKGFEYMPSGVFNHPPVTASQ